MPIKNWQKIGTSWKKALVTHKNQSSLCLNKWPERDLLGSQSQVLEFIAKLQEDTTFASHDLKVYNNQEYEFIRQIFLQYVERSTTFEFTLDQVWCFSIPENQ